VNIGAFHGGTGNITINGPGVGDQVNVHESASQQPHRADVGVLTVLTEELRAVVDVFQRAGRFATARTPGGATAYHAVFPAGVRCVAMQTLDRGPRSAAVAYQRMRHWWRPPVVLLVGIAGGIGEKVDVGDVVIADQVVYYDARRDTADGPRRRGQDQPAAAVLRHRLNDFFLRYGDTVPLAPSGSVRVLRGPIGSGDAVVTDAGSDIRRYLLEYNEKTLAVETEAAGVAQAFYEELGEDPALRGWLTIRGISDRADRLKGDDRHREASEHAAAVMAALLPFLKVDLRGP
jgi:adenosylhomocysteine nucleosidase